MKPPESKESTESTFHLPTPWGPWATLGWTVLIGWVFFIVQVVTGVVYLSIRNPDASAAELKELFNYLGKDGQAVAIMTVVGGMVCTGVITMIIRLRRVRLPEYLALRPVPLKQLVFWVAVIVVYGIAFNLVTGLLDRDTVTEFMHDISSTSGPMPLFMLGIVIVAPIFEEVFFRGFIFTGLERSPMGVVGAITITAAVWTIIHTQYDWYVLVQIFGLGLIFGYARHRSKSLLPALIMHMQMNLMGILEMGWT